MDTFHTMLDRGVVESIGWALVHSAWQIAFLALLYAALRVWLRHRAASIRYGVACVTLATMVVTVAATFGIVWAHQTRPVEIEIAETPVAPVITPAVEPAATWVPGNERSEGPEFQGSGPPLRYGPGTPKTTFPTKPRPIVEPAAESVVLSSEPPPLRMVDVVADWLPWLVTGWLLGVAGFSARLACGYLGLRRLRRESVSPAIETMQKTMCQLAERLGVRKAVQLVESVLVEVPTVVGHVRPIVLLPAAMVTGLSPRQIEAILAHELAHIRRHDYLVNLIQSAIETVLFYHPAMWWISRQIRQERENCCDDLVLSIDDDRIGYARALARVAELRSAAYRPAVAISGGSLMTRIRRIVGRPTEGPGRRHAWLAGMLLLSIILAAMVGLMGSASGSDNEQDAVAKEEGPPRVEVVLWQAIVDGATANQLVNPKDDSEVEHGVDLKTNKLLKILRQADKKDDAVFLGERMHWVDVSRHKRTDSFLGDLHSNQQKDSSIYGFGSHMDMMCPGTCKMSVNTDDAKLSFEALPMVSLTLSKQNGPGGRTECKLPRKNKKIEWSGRIETGHVRAFVRPMEGTNKKNYTYVLIAQAVSAPENLCGHLRASNMTRRWLDGGLDGALADIRSARRWEKDAPKAGEKGQAATATYTAPDGQKIEILALGRPDRWPHHWWDTKGQPIQGNPAWQKHARCAKLAVIVRCKKQSGAFNLKILPTDFTGSIGSSSAGSSAFGENTYLYYIYPGNELSNKDFTDYLDEGGQVDIVVRFGSGKWTKIDQIKEGQQIKTDDGRFQLKKVRASRAKRPAKSGFLGIGSRPARPGMIVVNGKYEYDPGFEVVLAAVDAQGERTIGLPSSGSGQFERFENRRWHNMIQVDKTDVDHFDILKRPVVEHWFQNVPARPIINPDVLQPEEPLRTEVLFWHALVDASTAEKMMGQKAYTPAMLSEGLNLDGDRLLTILRGAGEKDDAVLPGRLLEWATPVDRLPDRLRKSDKMLQWQNFKQLDRDFQQHDVRGKSLRQTIDMRCEGRYIMTPRGQDVDLELHRFSNWANLNNYPLLGGSKRSEWKASPARLDVTWTGRLSPGRSRVFLNPMKGDAQRKYYYLLVAQAVAVPNDLGEDVQQCSLTKRWIAEGVKGSFAQLRSARQWRDHSVPPDKAQSGSTETASSYATPEGATIEIVAIGRPDRWPYRWWNARGKPLQADPAWDQAGDNASLVVVVRCKGWACNHNVFLRAPDFDVKNKPTNGTAYCGDADKPRDTLLFRVISNDRVTNKLHNHLDEGSPVELVVQYGAGSWTKIGRIQEGQQLIADGGRFQLKEIRPSGDVFFLTSNYDYDPAFDVAIAAVDRQGKRAAMPLIQGDMLFNRRKDNWRVVPYHLDKDDVDHFEVLKRPVAEYVFEKVPTRPVVDLEVVPDVSDEVPFGQVVDSHGQAIAKATVTSRGPRWPPNGQPWTVKTDAKGRFPFPPIERGQTVVVRIDAAGFVSKECLNLGRDHEDNYFPSGNYVMRRVATISGRVLGPDGKPLVAAPISLDVLEPNEAPRQNYAQAITDEQGRFTIDDVIPGPNVLYYPWSGERGKDLASGRWKAFLRPNERCVRSPVHDVCGALNIDVEEGDRINDLTLDLSQSTGIVEGRLFAPDGTLLADEPISLSRRITAEGCMPSLLANISGGNVSNDWTRPRTDSEGRFRLEGIGPGEWQIYGPTTSEYEPQYETVQVVSGKTIHQDLHVTESYSAKNDRQRLAAARAASTPDDDIEAEKPGAPCMSNRQLEESNNPLLVKAREVDPHFERSNKANQQLAESRYLEFIKKHPNHALVPYLYCHLGHTYGCWAGQETAEKRGIVLVRDEAKAGRYFDEAVAHHPADKISGLLFDALISSTASAPAGEARMRKYMDVYRRLDAITTTEIEKKAWWSKFEKKAIASDPMRKNILLAGLWNHRNTTLDTAAVNMVSIARYARGGKARLLLEEICDAFPDKPPGKEAAKHLAGLSKKSQTVKERKEENSSTSGRVTDAQGRGIANATVKRAKSSWTATTDAEGRFPLPKMKSGEQARLIVTAGGFLTLNEVELYCDHKSKYQVVGGQPIQLARPVTLTGRVLGPDGKPLADAPLSLDTWVELPQLSCTTGNYRSTKTDSQGQFRMEGIPPGSHVLYYPGVAPRSIPVKGVYGAVIVEPEDGQQLNGLVIDLSQSKASVEGRIFGPDGKPLAGSRVGMGRFHQWKGNSGGSGPHASSAKTGPDGRYKITGLGPGQWYVKPRHPHFQRSNSQKVITLAAGQTVQQDLHVTKYPEEENAITRAATEAERTDDLGKLHMGLHSLGGLPPVDRNLATFGQLIFLNLAPGRITDFYVKVKPLGLPSTATPVEVASAAHVGELYYTSAKEIVTLNGTIVAPFARPEEARGGSSFVDWIKQMTRAELVEQVEASRRENPDADGRRVPIHKGENYLVVRSDGQGYLMHVGNVSKDGAGLTFLYLGHLNLDRRPSKNKELHKKQRKGSSESPAEIAIEPPVTEKKGPSKQHVKKAEKLLALMRANDAKFDRVTIEYLINRIQPFPEEVRMNWNNPDAPDPYLRDPKTITPETTKEELDLYAFELAPGFKPSKEDWNGRTIARYLKEGKIVSVRRRPITVPWPEGIALRHVETLMVRGADLAGTRTLVDTKTIEAGLPQVTRWRSIVDEIKKYADSRDSNARNKKKQAIEIAKTPYSMEKFQEQVLNLQFALGFGYAARIREVTSLTKKDGLTILEGRFQMWEEDKNTCRLVIDKNNLVRKAEIHCNLRGRKSKFVASSEGTMDVDGRFRCARSGKVRHYSPAYREYLNNFLVKVRKISFGFSDAQFEEFARVESPAGAKRTHPEGPAVSEGYRPKKLPPPTSLDVRITAVKKTISPVSKKLALGQTDVLELPIRIENRSSKTIVATLPHEWHGGLWPPTDLIVAVKRSIDMTDDWRQCDAFLSGELSSKTKATIWKPGESHDFVVRMNWPGTGSIKTMPLIKADKPGKYEVRFSLVFQADGTAQTAVSQPLTIEVKKKTSAKPSRSIRGQVTDTDGKPIAGALVEWGYIYDAPKKWQQTKTDRKGRYKLELSDHGVGYRLGVSSLGKSPQWRLFFPPWNNVRLTTVNPPPEKVDFKLEPGHRAMGVVVDREGQPIAGARVQAKTAAGPQIYTSFSSPAEAMLIPGNESHETTTDKDGRFTLEGMPAEKVQLRIESPHRYTIAQNYEVDRDHRIAMNGSGRPGLLRAHVVDAATNKPIEQFKVALRYCPKPQSFESNEGHFTWRGNLTDQRRYETHVYAKGYAPRKIKLKATAQDSRKRPLVKLKPAPPLVGRLVDATTGKPLSGISIYYGVTIEAGSGDVQWSDLDRMLSGSYGFEAAQRAVTDQQGRFWFCEAKDGPKGTLIAMAEGYGRLIMRPEARPDAPGDKPLEIELWPESTISGTLYKPPAGAQVVVRRLKPELKKIREPFEYLKVDAMGRYRIGNLAPGTYYVGLATPVSRAKTTFDLITMVTLAAAEHKTLGVGTAHLTTEKDNVRQPAETSVDRSKPPLPGFGPEYDQTLFGPLGKGPGPCLIDFDTGRVMAWPRDGIAPYDPTVGFTDGFKRFMRQNGFDAIGHVSNHESSGIEGLIAFNMAVIRLDDNTWDFDPVKATVRCRSGERLAQQSMRTAESQPGKPRNKATYLFKTRENEATSGMLQFTLANTGTSVSFRYKRLLSADRLAAWSKPKDNLRMRFRPAKQKWTIGETPELLLDLWNVGPNNVFSPISHESDCEVQVDGLWYRWADIVAIDRTSGPIRSGQAEEGAIKIKLGRSWAQTDRPMTGEAVESERLHLAPGKHKIRVAVRPHGLQRLPQDGRAKQPRWLSRPVEIEIVKKDAKTSPTKDMAATSPNKDDHNVSKTKLDQFKAHLAELRSSGEYVIVEKGQSTSDNKVPASGKLPGWAKRAREVFPKMKADQCDAEPSVELGTARGQRLLLSHMTLLPKWRQLPPRQSGALDFGNGWQVYSHIDIVTFPETAELPNDAKSQIAWKKVDQQWHARPVDLGTGLGRRWFARTTIFWQEELRDKLKLQGGDDRLRLITEGLAINDMVHDHAGGSRTSTGHNLLQRAVDQGDTILPYIERALEKTSSEKTPSPANVGLINALGRIDSPAATQMILRLYEQRKTRGAATDALILGKPRKEAKAIYFDLLKRQAYIRSASEACAKLGWTDAVPLLRAIYVKPTSWEFRPAFEAMRQLQGKPVPSNFYKAEQTLLGDPIGSVYNPKSGMSTSPDALDPSIEPQSARARAKKILLGSPDVEAVAIVAARLAEFRGYGSVNYKRLEATRRAGMELLEALPRDVTRPLLKRLEKHFDKRLFDTTWDRGRFTEIIALLDAPQKPTQHKNQAPKIEIKTIEDVPAALKARLIAWSDEFPQLAGMKDVKVNEKGFSYRHNCKWLGKQVWKESWRETGPDAVGIDFELMPLEEFLDKIRRTQMQTPSYRWENLGKVGWIRLHVGTNSPPNLSRLIKTLVKMHVAMIDRLEAQTHIQAKGRLAGQSDRPKSAKSDWGKPIDGVRARLHAKKTTYKAGEDISLLVDVRNDGKKRWALVPSHHFFIVEWDGYEYWKVDEPIEMALKNSMGSLDLRPGSHLKDIPVVLAAKSGVWRSSFGPPVPPPRTPGKHKVRVLLFPQLSTSETIKVTSNTIEIEIAEQADNGQAPKAKKVAEPKTATLVLRYDMPGDEPKGRFQLHRKTGNGDRGETHENLDPVIVKNGELTRITLRHGIYDVSRLKSVEPLDRRANLKKGPFMCDRRDVELKSHEETKVDFVRGDDARPISGCVAGLPKDIAVALYVTVRSADATGDPRPRDKTPTDEALTPMYDVISCLPNKLFNTAPISPGKYTLVATAYRRWEPPLAGAILPDFVGTAKVTVPTDGNPSEVDIKMQPRKKSSSLLFPKEIMIPDAPKTARDVKAFYGLHRNMTMADVVRRCGLPDEDVGSGIHIFVYRLKDGSTVRIGTGNLKFLIYVHHVGKSGKIKKLLPRKKSGPQKATSHDSPPEATKTIWPSPIVAEGVIDKDEPKREHEIECDGPADKDEPVLHLNGISFSEQYEHEIGCLRVSFPATQDVNWWIEVALVDAEGNVVSKDHRQLKRNEADAGKFKQLSTSMVFDFGPAKDAFARAHRYQIRFLNPKATKPRPISEPDAPSLDEVIDALAERNARYGSTAFRIKYKRTVNDFENKRPRTEYDTLVTQDGAFREEARVRPGGEVLTTRISTGTERAEVDLGRVITAFFNDVDMPKEHSIQYYAHHIAIGLELTIGRQIWGFSPDQFKRWRDAAAAGNLRVMRRKVAGIDCVLVTSPGGGTTALAPQYGWAPVEWERGITATGFHKYGDFWMPSKVEQKFYSKNFTEFFLFRNTLEITDVKTGLEAGVQSPDGTNPFILPKPKPGERIRVPYQRWDPSLDERMLTGPYLPNCEHSFKWSKRLSPKDAAIWQISKFWRDKNQTRNVLPSYTSTKATKDMRRPPMPFWDAKENKIVWAIYNDELKQLERKVAKPVPKESKKPSKKSIDGNPRETKMKSPSREQAKPDVTKSRQKEAIAEIMMRGGEVVRDENDPAKPVIAVNLDQIPSVEARLEHLDAFPQLKRLSLSNTRLTDAGLERISHFANLEKLYIGGTRITDAGLAHLRRLPKLKLLFLTYDPITNAGLKNLKGMKSLTHLKLDYTKIDDAGLKIIEEGLPRIEALWLSNTRVTDAGLAGLDKLPRLRVLIVSGTSDAGLKHIGRLSKLQTLYVEHAHKITDQGLAHLKTLSQLRQLSLNMVPKVTDVGVLHLTALTKLRTLRLWGSKVTDHGLERLEDMSQLTHLAVGDNVTPAGLKRFHRALPKCWVHERIDTDGKTRYVPKRGNVEIESKKQPRQDNAAPIYFDAFYEFSSDMERYFPEEEKARRTPIVKDREERFKVFYNAWMDNPESLDLVAADALLREYETGFKKLALAQRKKRCVFSEIIPMHGSNLHIVTLRVVSHVIQLRIERNLAQGKLDRVLDDIEMMLRLGRDIRHQGGALELLADSLIERDVCGHQVISRLLTSKKFTVAQCDRLIAILSRQEATGNGFTNMFKKEHEVIRSCFHDLEHRKGIFSPEQVDTEETRVVLHAIGFRSRKWDKLLLGLSTDEIYQQVGALDDWYRAVTEVTDAPIGKQLETSRVVEGKYRKKRFPVSILLDNYETVLEHVAYTITSRRGILCLAAFRRWQLIHGKPPADLKTALKDVGIESMPRDPFDKGPLRTKLNDKWVIVYSVGPDGDDDNAQFEWDLEDGWDSDGDITFGLSLSL